MTYQRVLPRDLFNEAKLLKCVGKLTLLIGDELINWIDYSYDDRGFLIDQQSSDGSLFVSNMHFTTKDGQILNFFTPYNSKGNWPLVCIIEDDEVLDVFNENGDFILTNS